MKFTDLAVEIPYALRAGHAVNLESKPGRGKSSFANWLVEEQTRYYGEKTGKCELFLGTQSPPDLQGYLFKGEVEYGGKTYSITDPTLPTWFICDDGKPCLAYKHGLVILDEYGKGATDTKSASAELLLHGRIGKHHLPDGFGRLALSNFLGDRSGETKRLDFVINRTVQLTLSDDLRGTIMWYESHGASYQMLAFLEDAHCGSGEPICFEPAPEKQGPWSTPRSLFMCDQYLREKASAQGDPNNLPYDDLTVEMVQGYIGVPAANELFKFLVVEREQPKYAAIVADPDGVRVPGRADAQMAVCYNLATNAEPKHLAAIIKYISRFPADFAVTFTRSLLRRQATLVAHPAMLDWSSKNANLISQVAALNTYKF